MKATGIVRRLDELGRLVIPKEIRKQYRLKEGDSIEFFIDNDRVVIQKHDTMAKHKEDISVMCETMKEIYGNTVFFLHDQMIKDKEHPIDEDFLQRMKVRNISTFQNDKVFQNDENRYYGIMYPIIVEGHWYGGFIMLFDKHDRSGENLIVMEGFAKLLTRQYEQ